jgi:F-type H+-transporting ATPase subunit b
LLESARNTLAAERDQAATETRAAALDLAMDIAGRLLRKMPANLPAEAWLDSIQQHLASLPKPDRDGLIRQLTDGAVLKVVTARALPAETAESWRNELHRALGDQVAITFATDPQLIEGAELHFPDAILRFSWKSALESLRAETEAHGDAR